MTSARLVLIHALILSIGMGVGSVHARKSKRGHKKPPVVALDKRAEIRAKRSDLQNVKRHISDLQGDLEKSEAMRREAVEAVTEAEREVSRATRALRKVMADRTEAERRLAELEAAQTETEKRIAARRAELGDWLRRNYMYGTTSDVVALLSAHDPNQFARDAYYLERLGQARLALIGSLKADLELEAEHARQIEERRQTLVRMEEDRRRQHQRLESTLTARRDALKEIASLQKSQHEQIDSLKTDEEHLARVVDTLVQQVAQAAVRREQEREREQKREQAVRRQNNTVRLHAAAKPEPVVGRVKEVAGAAPGGVNFSQLRGRLNFPVAGELIGSFGAPRTGQGTVWRGVFIRAAAGAEVRAVSAGEVVFSDWLRGYGNLLIVDHGGGYLSIYGNNDALFKESGDIVHSGEAIASVGTSGYEAESGLYFEIRHKGQAIDPIQWVRLK